MQVKVASLEGMASGHWTNLLDQVLIMGISYSDTDFAPQMKLTKLSLIHCFWKELYKKIWLLPSLENSSY